MSFPACCCTSGCSKCTHRHLDAAAFLWSANVFAAGCDATAVDMVLADGLYVLGRIEASGRYILTKWNADTGAKVWDVLLAIGFAGLRVDTDGTQVWVGGIATAGQPNLYAFAASNRAALWSVDDGAPDVSLAGRNSVYDVEPDGEGGAYVARKGAEYGELPDVCEAGDGGYVSHYDSTGTLLNRFGGHNVGSGAPTARSLLLSGGSLYVGSTQFQIDCPCPAANEWLGHLAKYTAGALDWFTGHILAMPNDGYPNRLALGDGRLFAGMYDGDEGCNVIEWDPSTGEFVAGYSLDPNPTNGYIPSGFELVDALDANADGLLFAAGGLLWESDLDGGLDRVRENSGADATPTTIVGDYRAVALGPPEDLPETPYTAYAGGYRAGCTDDDSDATTGDINECTPDGLCECGDRTPTGGTRVAECPCTDGIPCDFDQLGLGTGCLACLAGGTISWVQTDELEWTGTQTWCVSDPDGTLTIVATYDCETGWTVTGTITVPGVGTLDIGAAEIIATWCAADAPADQPQHPWLSGAWTFDAAYVAAHPAYFSDCGEGEGGCVAFGPEGTCDGGGTIPTDCCPDDLMPENMVATVTGAFTATVALTYNPGGPNWFGTFTGCGSCGSMSISVTCQSGIWKVAFRNPGGGCVTCERNVDATSAVCSPLMLTFDITHFGGCACGASTQIIVTAV
jgi:hypothetical protein